MEPPQSRYAQLRQEYATILRKCARSRLLEDGRRVHARIIHSGHTRDRFLGNLLVQMYRDCGRLEDARAVFDSMPLRNEFSWAIIISAYVGAGKEQEALCLYRALVRSSTEIQPDAFIFSSALAACARLKCLEQGLEIHEQIVKRGIKQDVGLQNALVTMYAKCGRIDRAKQVFDRITHRDVVVISWNAMIAGFGQNGRPKQALELFRRMDLEGLQPSRMTYCSVLDACANLTASSLGRIICDGMDEALAKDISVANSICNMYGKCGLPELARQTFLEMTYRDVVSWTAIIAAYAQNGYSSEALDIFRIMVQAGVEPNGITLINTLSACSHGALFDEGSDIFSSLVSGDYYGVTANESHFLCAIDLLGRAGYLKDAETLITKMPFKAGAVAWTSLLSACRTFRDLKRAGRVANHLFELDESSIKDPAPYVMLSNIYASAGDRAAEMKLRDQIRIKCRKKLPGKSTITIKGQTNEFYSLDETHPRRDDAYNELRRLFQTMKEAGYVPDTRIAEMEEEETEQSLSYHSEKLALAFGVLNTPPEASLCIVKNLRVCSDCHNVIKFLSKHLNRKIAVRDATRFHHFENGFCSCRDCW
ncbi:hypothetical protein SELMODRAFT_180944 [Selaginella moellendorffii]|uniref:DYW domain-containing protein n=1 Tax=Selaginella moellendorffii TaxID=88036 RepID=D8SM22_SELML|nr:hypothetical protein SELMODRAFT_180944 [Selaginella moellendorffii]